MHHIPSTRSQRLEWVWPQVDRDVGRLLSGTTATRQRQIAIADDRAHGIRHQEPGFIRNVQKLCVPRYILAIPEMLRVSLSSLSDCEIRVRDAPAGHNADLQSHLLTMGQIVAKPSTWLEHVAGDQGRRADRDIHVPAFLCCTHRAAAEGFRITCVGDHLCKCTRQGQRDCAQSGCAVNGMMGFQTRVMLEHTSACATHEWTCPVASNTRHGSTCLWSALAPKVFPRNCEEWCRGTQGLKTSKCKHCSGVPQPLWHVVDWPASPDIPCLSSSNDWAIGSPCTPSRQLLYS